MLYTALTTLHVIGAAIGLGGATMSDLLFFRAIKDRLISTDQFHLLQSAATCVSGGLVLVVVTGLPLLLMNPEMLAQPRVQAKLTAVLVLIVNGFILHFALLRFLERHVDRHLEPEDLERRHWLFAGSGATSIVSWYTPLVLATVGYYYVRLPYIELLGLYIAAILAGTLVAYLIFAKKVIYAEVRVDDVVTRNIPGTGFPWSMALLVVLLASFIGTVVYLWWQ